MSKWFLIYEVFNLKTFVFYFLIHLYLLQRKDDLVFDPLITFQRKPKSRSAQSITCLDFKD